MEQSNIARIPMRQTEEGQRLPQHPKTTAFLDHYNELTDRHADLDAQLTEASIVIGTQRKQIGMLEGELARLRTESTTYARGFFALKAELAALGMIGRECATTIGNAVVRALEAVNREMDLAGVEAYAPQSETAAKGEDTDDH